MQDISIKICGMKHPGNVEEVAALGPDYIGFIMYIDSPRYIIPEYAVSITRKLPASIKKTGVLVNESLENAVLLADSKAFDFIQLHGNEDPEYCRKLSGHVSIIKAFRVSGCLPHNLTDYQSSCTMFLFDTAGKKLGGTGEKFNHNLLMDYSLSTKYLIGGGISPADAGYIKSLRLPGMAGIDLNSRFESEPGIKDIDLLKNFIRKIKNDTIN